MTKQTSEQKLKKELNKYPNIMTLKLQTNTHSHQNTPFDYLIFTPTKSIAIEVKELKIDKTKRFNINRIKPHQIKGLEQFTKTNPSNKAYIMIRFKTHRNKIDTSYIIPIEEYTTFTKKLTMKSFTTQELEKNCKGWLKYEKNNWNLKTILY